MTQAGGLGSTGTLFSLHHTFVISGRITLGGTGLPGVTLGGLPGNPVTDAEGHFSATVPLSWTGTVTPTLRGYRFTPTARTYTDLETDQSAQDYVGTHFSVVRRHL